MEQPIQLVSIPKEEYSEYRYNVIFKAYKWDPQVGDHNTVSQHAVLMSKELAGKLNTWAEQMAQETVKIEQALARQLPLVKELGLPGKIIRAMGRSRDYDAARHVRLMRFDFHPTADGWNVSEVNSDVPGGFAEASVLPQIAREYYGGYAPETNTAESLLQALQAKVDREKPIAFVHATSYADDRQVMQFLSDYFVAAGLRTIFAAPDHIRWQENRAVSVLAGNEGELGAVVRFFPLEWLLHLPSACGWEGYFGSVTPSCNHPVAMLTQSKRLPLVWDRLGVEHPVWEKLLPETRDTKTIKRGDAGWIYKPALGRVGEGISIKGAVPPKELRAIEKAAHRVHKDWVAQRLFESIPLTDESGQAYHLCVGVFTIEGRSAGFYGRISPYARIDSKARDIPILVEE